jgi:hypothetical protein
MKSRESIDEQIVLLEGPALFLDTVYETIEGYLHRIGEPYEQVITAIEAEDAGDVDHETEAVLHVYVPATVEPDEALTWVERALDRIADEHDMTLTRQGVQVSLEEASEEL